MLNITMKRILLLIFILLPLWLSGQRFIYDIDFTTYFDNREYHNPYTPSQTIFGMRLTPVVGVELYDSLGGRHLFRAGVTYIQPFGAPMHMGNILPTVYYQFQQSGFTLNFGTVPYYELYQALPNFLMSDSLRFAYPNIQGALLGYRSEQGYVQFFCDWRGLQSKTIREAFRLVILGQYQYQWFQVGGYGQINHLANKALSEPNLGVCDDIVISPYLGGNFSDYTPLDTLAFRIGYMGGYYTDRKAGEMQLSSGVTIDFSLRWRFLGLKNSFYYGQGQMPYYARYGQELYQGSPFYQAKLYNRTDLMLYLLRREMVHCYFAWNLHVVDGYGLSNQQQLVLRFNFGNVNKRNKKSGDGAFDFRKKKA